MRYVVRNNSVVTVPDFSEIITQKCHVALVFTKLNLVAWRDIRPLVQRRATVFAYNADKSAAYAGFMVTSANCNKVAELIRRSHRMRGVYISIPGTDAETLDDVAGWIYCWLDSFAYQTKDAYCSVENYDPDLYSGITGYRDYLDKPVSEAEFRLTLPCKCARPDNMSSQHPERFKQQCLEVARAKGCDRCPLFNIDRFHAETIKDRKPNPFRLTGKGIEIDVQQLLKNITDND